MKTAARLIVTASMPAMAAVFCGILFLIGDGVSQSGPDQFLKVVGFAMLCIFVMHAV
jgi:hypothetical protein